jgi:hypothetical protein
VSNFWGPLHIIKTNDHVQKGRWSILEHGSGINRDQNPPDTSASKQAAPAGGATAFEMPRLAATWEEFRAATGAKAEGYIA